MITKRTAIGLGVGGTITAIGLYALITSLGIQTAQVDDNYGIGESTSYKFYAPAHSKQFLEIKGKSFDLELKSPKGGLQIPKESYKNELSLEWVHLEDGESSLKIQNTGDSEITVKGTVKYITEFIQITFHIMVVTAGLVIVGFSAGFSVRKPRGF